VDALLRQVVTFARDPRRGNPAYALAVEAFPPAEALQATCALLRTDVLAVVERPDDPAPALRFVTPSGAHAGAGHAAMAAAHLAFERKRAAASLEFRLDGGACMAVRRSGERIAVDWPVMVYAAVDDLGALERASGARPTEAMQAAFGVVAVFGSEAEVAALEPDMAETAALGRALIATAPGSASDIVIRVFAPHAGLSEDPVCGTAHRIIVPYWSARLAREAIHSRHLSRRGGDLICALRGDVVSIEGETLGTISGALDRAVLGSYVQP
jgi:predicted PhzF superfamily epimerase YddE/YHI9